MNIERSLKVLVETGKVHYGVEQAKKAAEMRKAKMIIVSENCPEEAFMEKKYMSVPIYHFKGRSSELGAACGKPFTVSAVTVLDAGESDILEAGKE